MGSDLSKLNFDIVAESPYFSIDTENLSAVMQAVVSCIKTFIVELEDCVLTKLPNLLEKAIELPGKAEELVSNISDQWGNLGIVE